MLKKVLVASAIFALSSNAAFAGAYVGADLGANFALYKEEPQGLATVRFGDVGPMADLFVGYGQLVKEKFYLGGEAFTTGFATRVKAIDSDDFTHSFDTRYSYGVSLIPGVMISDNTMAYARVGVVRTGFRVKTSVEGYDESTNEISNGGQAGLGLQTHLTPNLDLRGEYDFTSYKSFTTGEDEKITPTSGQVKLGLVYKFN